VIATRPIEGLEKDLIWYLSDADAACGFSSAGMDGNGNPDGRTIDDVKLVRAMFYRRGSSRRWERIRRQFDMASPEDRAILRAVYEPHGWPTIVRHNLRLPGARHVASVTGILHLSRVAEAAYEKRRAKGESMVDFLDRSTRLPGQDRMFADIRRELVAVVDAALLRYAQAVWGTESPPEAVDDGMAPLAPEG
jgi:hypothetical protein